MTKKLLEPIKEFIWATRRFVRKYITRHLRFSHKIPVILRAFIYLSPALILLGVFTFYPIINSFFISFLSGYQVQIGEFNGFTLVGNYVFILRNSDFHKAILNTAIIVGISVPITILLSLLIAVALNSIKPLKGFFQTIFFLPYVTNTIALGLVFAYIFSGNRNTIISPAGLGLANIILKFFGLNPIAWIDVGGTYWTAMFVILVYTVWNGLAFKIIVFLSGIQGIDKQYYQAAQIDGASKSKAFGRITVPLLSPMIFYILVTSVIGAFKTYTSVVGIIGVSGRFTAVDGDAHDLRTIVFYIYDYLSLLGVTGSMSYAAAASIILFLIILVFTIIQLQVGKRRVHY